jgi:hypothetical protein
MMTMDELANLITECESGGMISKKDYAKEVVEESDYLGGDVISDYNEYLEETGGETWEENTDENIDELFSSPSEAIRAAKFGDYNQCDDYFQLDGYGNLKSASLGDVEEEAKHDIDFLDWVYHRSNNDFIAEARANEEEVIAKALELVKKGA